MARIMPIHRLSAIRPLSLHYADGYWNSNDTLTMTVPKPDGCGTMSAAPINLPRYASDAEEVFPNVHLEETDHMFGEKGVTVTVHPFNGDRYADKFKVKLTEKEDGIFAVFCRDEGQPLYDAYDDMAEAANYRFGIPEAEKPGLNVRKEAEVVDEEVITEEVEVEQYGETMVRERPVGTEVEEGRRWFAVRVRLYASKDTEETPEDFIDRVEDYVFEPGNGTFSDDVPNLSYFPEDPTCNCDNRGNSSLVERHDKTQTMRCGNCGGTYTTRNRREIAHEPRRY